MVRLHAPVLERLPLHRYHDRRKKTPYDPQRRKGIPVCPSSQARKTGGIHRIGKQIDSIPLGILRKILEPLTEAGSRKKVESRLLNTAEDSVSSDVTFPTENRV